MLVGVILGTDSKNTNDFRDGTKKLTKSKEKDKKVANGKTRLRVLATFNKLKQKRTLIK